MEWCTAEDVVFRKYLSKMKRFDDFETFYVLTEAGFIYENTLYIYECTNEVIVVS
jgi:hypothetical protein